MMMRKMQNILIYGTGNGALRFYKKITDQHNIVGFVVSSAVDKNTQFMGKPVSCISDISSLTFDAIFLANEFADTYYECIKHGVDKNKIKILFYKCYFDVLEKVLQEESPMFDDTLQPGHPVITRALSYQTESGLEVQYTSSRDYVRFKLLELLAEQITKCGVQGSVAELGVYQGNFAKYINALFPTRALYLFDTFEGFDAKDEQFDVENGHVESDMFDHVGRFTNTTLDLVLSKMTSPEKCIVCKGFFPETARDIEDQFALVSLDADLYKPMLAGLEYFYPRLAPGGFLMLHDYNHPKFLGVKQAVADFEKTHGVVAKIPMPDKNGTLLITKV